MRIISRSSINQLQRCPRAAYHKYFDPEGGPGFEAVERPDYYAVGIAFHETGELLLRDSGPEAAARVGMESARALGLAERWQHWIASVAHAWYRTERDKFVETYDVLSIEEELLVPILPEVTLFGRADAVLRERSTGALYVWNWKTTSDLRDWNKKFFFDIQTWTESLAVSAKLGEEVDGVLYGGVWKGPMYKGYTTSRLVGGYKSPSGDSWSPARAKGHPVKFNAWEETFPFGAGIPAWVSWLPSDLVSSHFAISAPQKGKDDLIEGWLRSIARYESDIDHILTSGSVDDVRDFFYQHISEDCTKCPYLDICAGRADGATLVRDGFLKERSEEHMPTLPAEEGE